MELVSSKFVEVFQTWEKNLNSSSSGCKKIYTLKEVSFHETIDDCWVVIYDRVYDLTQFLEKHPGGWEVLLEYAGKDATLAFRGSGHSKSAVDMLKEFHVGDLPLSERIFRKIDGFKITNIPD